MAEQQNNKEKESRSALVSAAKAIGSAAGKIASLAGAAAGTSARPEYKDGTYQAKYIGSGTFLISKPKRKRAKLRQSRLKGTVRGARK